MKTLQFKVSVTMPDNNFVDATYLQALLQYDFNIIEDEGRWKVEVKELEEENEQNKKIYD